jgi:HPt (histidine-containing phosphotransfer) domain-containing protein
LPEDPFAPLRLRFLDRCRSHLATLKAISRNYAGDSDLLATAHSLAGAGGTFGFPAVSERASHLEELLLHERESGFIPSDATRAARQAALDDLVEELERMLA